MVNNKPSCSPEGKKLKNLTKKNKGQSSKPNRYRGKKMGTKTQGPELEDETNFKGWCSYLEGYILNLGTISSDNFPGLWRIWSDILGQPTAISIRQTSWPRHWKPSLTHKFQQSPLTRAQSVPIRIHIWPTSKWRTLTRPSVRNWGRSMCMRLTWTISTILFWVRQTSNYKIRRNQTPSSRRSRQDETPLGTWLY